MRLIDADKLMLSLNDNYLANSPTGNETLAVQDYRESVCEGLEIAMATVEGAPTVGGWISVKDRLPRDQYTVIVAISDDSGDTPYKYAYFGWFMSEANCWIVDDEIRRGEVYAWMPLPEPPKEG